MADIDSDGLDILAGEYVLGTLAGPPRAEFIRMMDATPALRERVAFWENGLAPLALSLVAVPPMKETWAEIERLTLHAPEPITSEPGALDRQAKFWRAAAITAALVAVILAAVLVVRQPSKPVAVVPTTGQRFAVLVDDHRQPLWIAHTDAAGSRLEIAPVRPVSPPEGKVFELWLTAANAAPRSLGLLRASGQAIDHLPASFANGEALSISIEPATGSPLGAPTSPFDAIGALVDPGGFRP
jgi:anti-sigma-K factor RskA